MAGALRHDLTIQTRPISELTPWAKNPRDNDAAAEELAYTISEVGWTNPILLDKHGTIIAGHTRLKAAIKLGLTEVPTITLDVDGPQAELIAIADNRLSEFAEWDKDALAEILESLQAEGIDTKIAGYGDDDLSELLASLDSESIGPDDIEAEDQDRVFSNESIAASAFTYFRATGFPYWDLKPHQSMQEINALSLMVGEDGWSGSSAGYHVADTYHPHRLLGTTATMRSPASAFEDDKWLRRALDLQLEQGGKIGTSLWGRAVITSGVQACANFRPAVAMMMYRRHCPDGGTVLDTSTGYGGRLVGFFASANAAKYIGIDPSTETHAGNLRMAQDLGFSDSVRLINLPAEDVSHDDLEGSCDFAFTSPPYFSKEHYADEETQSFKRYKTPEDWRDGFLGPMLALQFAALKPGSKSIVNIADVTVGSLRVPLELWTVESAIAAGFDHTRTEKFPLTRRFGANQSEEVAYEPMFVFTKPGALDR